ncbi:hypothetical protein [Alicyclobacillus acidoterrestris]|uniref:Uncharacterized protein n=1 Tax=Alicyclobacillus acidoterrestris (strain ATCC 49025 / DSM 3922 / CIP 106132 / NCIMB 13137 / GD3B) TaxID=1356854 RepID=T0DI14_ALIAG|nr:hypothetical protein [Alicyclobacillus acidoterrestris]EPZ49206.1 hypothetical protein N007_21170 [Alicyclobacillus acidoterrestris ATCC 49025]UNO47877.1 hypothetical protein K1I37_14445 [Alicyclobacillus acidoterrestris]
MHPLYPVACRMVGCSVVAHHVYGRKYAGVLQSVTPSGIYLLHSRVVVSFNNNDERSVGFSILKDVEGGQADLVYGPAAYFGFGALTGLALGGAAGGFFW